MKSFLSKAKVPIIKFGMLPDNTFFSGDVPFGFNLCVCPGKYIVLDVDVNDIKNGFDNIPKKILEELSQTFNYQTKRKGRHYWIFYTGNQTLANKTSGLNIDLRVGEKQGNAGGYVVWYPKEDVRDCLHLIKESSEELNKWLESLFSYRSELELVN